MVHVVNAQMPAKRRFTLPTHQQRQQHESAEEERLPPAAAAEETTALSARGDNSKEGASAATTSDNKPKESSGLAASAASYEEPNPLSPLVAKSLQKIPHKQSILNFYPQQDDIHQHQQLPASMNEATSSGSTSQMENPLQMVFDQLKHVRKMKDAGIVATGEHHQPQQQQKYPATTSTNPNNLAQQDGVQMADQFDDAPDDDDDDVAANLHLQPQQARPKKKKRVILLPPTPPNRPIVEPCDPHQGKIGRMLLKFIGYAQKMGTPFVGPQEHRMLGYLVVRKRGDLLEHIKLTKPNTKEMAFLVRQMQALDAFFDLTIQNQTFTVQEDDVHQAPTAAGAMPLPPPPTLNITASAIPPVPAPVVSAAPTFADAAPNSVPANTTHKKKSGSVNVRMTPSIELQQARMKQLGLQNQLQPPIGTDEAVPRHNFGQLQQGNNNVASIQQPANAAHAAASDSSLAQSNTDPTTTSQQPFVPKKLIPPSNMLMGLAGALRQTSQLQLQQLQHHYQIQQQHQQQLAAATGMSPNHQSANSQHVYHNMNPAFSLQSSSSSRGGLASNNLLTSINHGMNNKFSGYNSMPPPQQQQPTAQMNNANQSGAPSVSGATQMPGCNEILLSTTGQLVKSCIAFEVMLQQFSTVVKLSSKAKRPAIALQLCHEWESGMYNGKFFMVNVKNLQQLPCRRVSPQEAAPIVRNWLVQLFVPKDPASKTPSSAHNQKSPENGDGNDEQSEKPSSSNSANADGDNENDDSRNGEMDSSTSRIDRTFPSHDTSNNNDDDAPDVAPAAVLGRPSRRRSRRSGVSEQFADAEHHSMYRRVSNNSTELEAKCKLVAQEFEKRKWSVSPTTAKMRMHVPTSQKKRRTSHTMINADGSPTSKTNKLSNSFNGGPTKHSLRVGDGVDEEDDEDEKLLSQDANDVQGSLLRGIKPKSEPTVDNKARKHLEGHNMSDENESNNGDADDNAEGDATRTLGSIIAE